MLKWGNKARVALLLTLVLALICACGQESQQKMTSFIMANGLVVQPSQEGQYINKEGLTVEINLPRLSGFKDTALEEKLNNRIWETAVALSDAPPPAYRGIKVRLPEDAVCSKQWVNVSVLGNFNDILSITFNRGMDYDAQDEAFEEYGTYLNQIKTLNIDLHTGEEIALAELFPKDSDYPAFLNTYMEQALDESYATEEGYYTMEQLKLAAPFRGIQPKQKFAVAPWGLLLYFDEETPEFDIETYPVSVTIPNWWLKQHGPFAQGFYDPKASLYADAALQTPHLLNWGQRYDRSVSDYWEEDGLFISINGQYSSQLPSAVQEKIRQLAQVDEAQLAAIKAQHSPESGEASYDVSVWAQCGSFYYAATQQTNQEERFVYKADTGALVQLGDLFKPGFDYESLLKAEIDRFIPEDMRQGQDSAALYEHMQWNVEEEGLGLYIPLGSDSRYVGVSYSDIGPENLVIFN